MKMRSKVRQALWILFFISVIPSRVVSYQTYGGNNLKDAPYPGFDTSSEKNLLNYDKENNGGGGWSQWSEWSLCSRTCDGGVSRQLRSCNSPEGCGGEPVRYKICNMQPCDPKSNISSYTEDEWRASQCTTFNEIPYGGALYVWTLHNDEREPCALTCRGTPKHLPSGHEESDSQEEIETDGTVIAVLADRVLDGTRCRFGSLDMCIDGRCQRVGCDLKVGSTRRVDECGVCGGDGSSCSKPRYKWMISSSTICSTSCGGGYKTTSWACVDKLTGSNVEENLCRSMKKPEKNIIRCNTQLCPFKWFVSEYGECSASCGGGVRERTVLCSRSENETIIGQNVFTPDTAGVPCAESPPEAVTPCNVHPCPEWKTEPWSGCSVSCGEGIQVRGVQCFSHDGNGGCEMDLKPAAQRSCTTGIPCPGQVEEDDIESIIPGVVYHTQPLIQQYPPPQVRAERLTGEQELPSEATFIKDAEFGSCSVSCGVGFRKREVHCKIFLEFSRTIATLPDSKCAGPKPSEETERCDMGPCTLAYGGSLGDSAAQSPYNGDRFDGFGITSNLKAAAPPGKSYSWKDKGYTSCSASCLSGVQELIIQCVRDEDGKNASPYMCDPNTKPESRIRTCNDHPCPPRWNYTEFSSCTKSCGIGIQTREVSCIHEVTRGGGNTVVVPHNMCPQPPPPDRQYCNVLDCPVRWHTGDWSRCSRTCGGGIKERKVECKQMMAQSHIVERPSEACGDPKPATARECNTRPCANGIIPVITHDNSSYIQHDPRKTKVTVKVGGSATIFSGTQVKIKCPVKGLNKTKVTWTKDGRKLEKSKKFKISKKGALRITSVVPRDAGVYSCAAGGSKAELQLIIKGRPGDFPSSEEVDRRAAPRTLHDPLADGRIDSRYRAAIVSSGGGTSEDQSHEQRPDYDTNRKYNKSVQKGKLDKSHDMFTITTTQRTPYYRKNEVFTFSREQRTIPLDYEKYASTPTDKTITYVENATNEINTENNKNNNIEVEKESDTLLNYDELVEINKEKTISLKQNIDFKTFEDEIKPIHPMEIKLSSDENRDAYLRGDSVFRFADGNEDENVIVSEPIDENKLGLKFFTTTRRSVFLEGNSSRYSEWIIGEWGHCCSPGTGLCLRHSCLPYGKGIQKRSVVCKRGHVCSTAKPVGTKFCRAKSCQPYWKHGPWSKCTGHCVDKIPQGWQQRVIECRFRHSQVRPVAACRNLPRPLIARRCDISKYCAETCEDSSRLCANVRAMNLCYVTRYKQRCCRSCGFI